MSSIASKDEERKVLNQIAMLLDSLGEDSYCGYAFAGCVEMAKENIDNDFCNSWQDKCDVKDKQAIKIHDQLVEANEKFAKLDTDYQCARNLLELQKDIAEKLEAKSVNQERDNHAMAEKIKSLDGKLSVAEQTIVKLKARLYDMEHPEQ